MSYLALPHFTTVSFVLFFRSPLLRFMVGLAKLQLQHGCIFEECGPDAPVSSSRGVQGHSPSDLGSILPCFISKWKVCHTPYSLLPVSAGGKHSRGMFQRQDVLFAVDLARGSQGSHAPGAVPAWGGWMTTADQWRCWCGQMVLPRRCHP